MYCGKQQIYSALEGGRLHFDNAATTVDHHFKLLRLLVAMHQSLKVSRTEMVLTSVAHCATGVT
jgi:hypothetical protein